MPFEAGSQSYGQYVCTLILKGWQSPRVRLLADFAAKAVNGYVRVLGNNGSSRTTKATTMPTMCYRYHYCRS